MSYRVFCECTVFVHTHFAGVDTPLQVFPVHTPVRRAQSGTLSGGHVVPGQVRRALPLHAPGDVATGDDPHDD